MQQITQWMLAHETMTIALGIVAGVFALVGIVAAAVVVAVGVIGRTYDDKMEEY